MTEVFGSVGAVFGLLGLIRPLVKRDGEVEKKSRRYLVWVLEKIGVVEVSIRSNEGLPGRGLPVDLT